MNCMQLYSRFLRWEFIKESKKPRKHAFDQESDQEKKNKRKKTRSRPRKRPSKKEKLFFLDNFWSRECFLSFFLSFFVFFYKFSPLSK